MADPKKLITKNHRLNTAKQVLESIDEPANTAYYAFFGKHTPYANSELIPQPTDSVNDIVIDIYRNMMFGKRVTSNDVKLMVKRNDYVSNTVYDMYDDMVGESDVSFFKSNYYVTVNAGSYWHLFKCLDNNQNGRSTVQPNFAEVDINDEVYQTSDGYIWKYMYSVSDTTFAKFATNEYFPVVANTQVSAAAREGVINVIKIENPGRGYSNYCNGTFRDADLRINGNSKVYAINTSLTANNTSGYYNGCYLYIVDGPGIGQYSKIVDYTVNSTIKAVVIDKEFSVAPGSNTVFEVSPGVKIIGDGTQTVNAEARAIINSVGNVVQRIEMLNIGADYKYSTASIVVANSVSVNSVAVLRPIYSPPGGHGYDAASELGATRLGFSTKFSNTDIEIPLTNEFRTIGILKDPMFANVTLEFSSVTGSFLSDERVLKISGVRIDAPNATINSTSSIITANADFVNQFVAGETFYLKSSDTHQLAVVNSITNSSYMTITTNGLFSCTETQIFKTNIAAYTPAQGVVQSVSAGSIIVSNVEGIFATSDKVIGETSGAFGVVSLVQRSGVTKGFDSFVQMYKYVGTPISGTFSSDESVFQSLTSSINDQFANAAFHSKTGTGATSKYFVTNQIGQFNSGTNMIGSNSNAIALITNKYSPELIFGSGDIIYLENIEPVTRSNNNSQTIKFIFEF